MSDRVWRKKSLIGRVSHTRFPSTMADYPFESILALWGVFSAISTFWAGPASGSLANLPEVLQMTWGGLMGLSGLTIGFGLLKHHYDTVSAGLYLLSLVLIAYACAVVGFSGWSRGGLTAGLVFSVGVICYVRGWWLKTRDRVERQEATRTEGE
jgi:hypothetical protein